MSTDTRYGAASAEWNHFSLILGLGADLLPVVSNPTAQISPNSTMHDLGKTPSRYNGHRHVVGIPGWAQHEATDTEVSRWSREPDYGICVNTRAVRAIDVDVPDNALATDIFEFIESAGYVHLPQRWRTNSGKFLLAFTLPGTMAKRVLKVEGGIIEFLATGQQFIAVGTHTSGVPYEWAGGLPDEFPVLSLEQFEALWVALDERFSVAPSAQSKVSDKAGKLAQATHSDPVAAHMFEHGMVRSQDRGGKLHIVCPWQADHTNGGHDGDTSTTYWPAHTGGYVQGHFKCLHAHCADRSDGEFKNAMGFVSDDDLSDFDDLGFEAGIEHDDSIRGENRNALRGEDDAADFSNETDGANSPLPVGKPKRFALVSAHDFGNRAPPTWIIKNILPRAELVVLFGESGAGKSFTAFDMAGAIARGVEWRGNRVKPGRVVYVAAEGAGGCRNRLVAYAKHQGIDLADMNLFIIPAAPNLLEKADALDVCRAIGRADVVFVDTFAQATAGANENSGEDIGKALSHCKGIFRATGATVVLVHHAGKDLSKGARGWSGLRAACDAEIEVSRQEPVRMLRMSKQKDGQDGLTMYFDLTQVPIGMDEDGDVITSCVMNYNVSAPVGRQAQVKLNQWETILMAQVTLIGASQSSGIEVKGVVSDALIAYRDGGGDNSRARDLLNRAAKTLASKDFFVIEDDCITLLESGL